MASILTLRANAKVNLGLHITGRRDDGYHLMETLYYPVHELYDEVELEARQDNECSVEMIGMEEVIPMEKNLCYRAFKALAEVHPWGMPGVHIRVRKRIPAGAGLAGGSSNAAAVLRGLRDLYLPEVSNDMLASLAEPLGADVPFFIYNRPLYATGIGTRFEEIPLDLGRYKVEVETLPVHSSTPEAFRGLDLAALPAGGSLRESLQCPIPEWKDRVRNDLEGPVFARYPEIARLKASFYASGATFALMTGSGSACFGMFPI